MDLRVTFPHCVVLFVLPWILSACAAGAPSRESARTPASDPATCPSTFSIAAFDPSNGDLGIAVASKFLAVGVVVPWVEADVGAVATQSYANTSFGPRGLILLRDGWSPEDAAKRLLDEDPEREFRQLGIVDAKGRSTSFTGKECIGWAGSRAGPNFAVQGNILVSEKTVEAMERAFRETKGELAERLLAALEAGDASGGDSRGRQSAAIVVARKGKGYGGFNSRYVDLRVDDAADPVGELRRLLLLQLGKDPISRARAAEREGRAKEALAILEEGLRTYPEWNGLRFEIARMLLVTGKAAGAREELDLAISKDPFSASSRVRAAGVLVRAGMAEEAVEELRKALKLEPEYAAYLRREVQSPVSPFRALASPLAPLLGESAASQPE